MRYSENGKCILDYQQQELIASLNVENKPQLSLADSMTLPGRTLAVIQVNTDLEPEQSGQIYEIEPNHYLIKKFPNLYIVPMIHNVDKCKTENVPLVIINFLTDSVYLLEGKVMGFMQDKSLNISEIVTETSTEPSPILLEDDDDIDGLQEQKRKVT